jgi:hypothetical protein
MEKKKEQIVTSSLYSMASIDSDVDSLSVSKEPEHINNMYI